VEIPGVSNMNFLRTALNEKRKANGLAELGGKDFLTLVRERAKLVEMDPDLMNRNLNVGFSGGEKKRNEIFQMAMLEPKLGILDETDSGLDIDALRIVAGGVNKLRIEGQRLHRGDALPAFAGPHHPDLVHVMADGKHHQERTEGTGAGAGGEGLRLGEGDRVMSTMTAIDPKATSASIARRQYMARCCGSACAGECPSRSRHQDRGVEIHPRRQALQGCLYAAPNGDGSLRCPPVCPSTSHACRLRERSLPRGSQR
jgi:hypothetical protein